jgi:signal transduction histidine kinase
VPLLRGQLLLMTLHDLTPLRRVEEMHADFVANASHELRTPLAALSGFIETLRGSARDDAEARDRFLAIMQAQATRMPRLIDDLLSTSCRPPVALPHSIRICVPSRRSMLWRSFARSLTVCRC